MISYLIYLIATLLNGIMLYPLSLPLFHFVLLVNKSSEDQEQRNLADNACLGLFECYNAFGLYKTAVKYHDQFTPEAYHSDPKIERKYQNALNMIASFIMVKPLLCIIVI